MRRFQFSIASLLVVTAGVGLMLGLGMPAMADSFSGSGERLPKDAKAAAGKAIDLWADQAFSARSRQFREDAVAALLKIPFQGGKLSDDELKALRSFGKRVLSEKEPADVPAFLEYRNRRESAVKLLARIPDKSCVPIFVALINKQSIKSRG